MNINKPKRKNNKYLKWLRTQPCCVSGKEAEPHHIRDIAFIPYEFKGGTGLKPYDLMAIPLYHPIHRMAHDDVLSFLSTCHPAMQIIKHLVRYIEEHEL